MAYSGKTFQNPQSGQSIKFLQTASETKGELLEMESTYTPHSLEPVPHFHPQQDEEFLVVKGTLSVRIGGELKVLQAGEKLQIPQKTVHSMWNDSDEETVVNWKVRPAMETEYLLETGMGLAADGKTDKKGTPSVLQASLLLLRFSSEFRLASPPFIVLRIVFNILRPFAYLLGYRATYEKYLD